MQQPASFVMNMIGMSPTTFRRKEEANEPLPDLVGHRVMGFLRVAATLRRLIDDRGDEQAVATFDLDAWLANWLRRPHPALGDRTPAQMLRDPEGLRAVEQVLERMCVGLPRDSLPLSNSFASMPGTEGIDWPNAASLSRQKTDLLR